jgi:hypothetical protein
VNRFVRFIEGDALWYELCPKVGDGVIRRRF